MTRTLGPYEIRSKLGRGVATVLWRAYDPVLEREVALREPVMPRDLDSSATADFLARFLHQGRAVAGLAHPGLVKVYAAEVYYGRPVLATELVEGENLAQVLARGALSPSSALYVLEQLLDATAYAHDEGMVHGAIAPECVLFGRDGRVKITDFGFSGLCSGFVSGEDTAAVGIPGYMAPEQARGEEVDRRADLFSIGVLGYEMLTGINPFGASEGLSTAAILQRVAEEPPAPFPADAQEEGRANLRAVLGAALAKDPARRFQSAEEFRAALHGAAVPAGTVLLAVAAARSASSPRGPVVVGPQPASRTRRRREYPDPYRRRRVGMFIGAAVAIVAIVAGVSLFLLLGEPSTGGPTTSAGASTQVTASSTTDSEVAIPTSTTRLTLVPGTTTTTTLAPSTTSTTTTTLAPSTTTTTQPTTTTRRPTVTTRRTTTTTASPTTTTQFVTPTTLGPGL